MLTTNEAVFLLQMLVKEQRARQIVNELMQGMAPLVRVHANAAQLVFDTLSLLLQILVPTLRPVSVKTRLLCCDVFRRYTGTCGYRRRSGNWLGK